MQVREEQWAPPLGVKNKHVVEMLCNLQYFGGSVEKKEKATIYTTVDGM